MTKPEMFPHHPFAELSSSQLCELARFTKNPNSAEHCELVRRASDETGTMKTEAQKALDLLNKESYATAARTRLPMEE